MAKKEGINTLQRLMNVVFIVWVLWFLYIMFKAVITGGLFKLTWSDIEATPIPFALLFWNGEKTRPFGTEKSSMHGSLAFLPADNHQL